MQGQEKPLANATQGGGSVGDLKKAPIPSGRKEAQSCSLLGMLLDCKTRYFCIEKHMCLSVMVKHMPI